MIAYTTLGVSDFEAGKAFYETLLGMIGATCVVGNERIALYGTDLNNPMLAVCIPYNEEALRATAPWWRFVLAAARPAMRCITKPSS